MVDASRDYNREYSNAQSVAASQKGKATGGSTAECHEGNWIHVRYEYPSSQPVTDAVFVVQKPNGGEPGGEVITEGVLTVTEQSEHEFIHVDLGDYNGEVEVFFFDDPTEPDPTPEPAPVEDKRAWYERAADAVISAGEAVTDGASWTWDVVQGDFNEDMSTGQIITNAVVTAIPGIDQVADLRDLIANSKLLLWDKRYNEIGVWVGVLACLIGLVPSLGSLAKGVIKLIWKNASDVGRILIYINKALFKIGRPLNGYRFLKRLADELPSQVAFVTKQFNEFLDTIVAKLSWGKKLAPQKVAEALATIEILRGMANQKFAEAAAEIRNKILRGLAKFATPVWSVKPGQSLIAGRATKVVRRSFDSWQDTMKRGDDFVEEALEAGAEPIDDKAARFFLDSQKLAQKWFDEIIEELPVGSHIRTHMEASRGFYLTQVLPSFSKKPKVIEFSSGQKLYRVIGEKDGIGGPFWSRSIPDDAEDIWRSQNAVRNSWNHAGAYVRASVPPPDSALIGEIAPQKLPNHPGMMLRGGGEQIFVPGPQGAAISKGQVDKYWHTNWNDPQNPSIGRVRAGNPNECDQ